MFKKKIDPIETDLDVEIAALLKIMHNTSQKDTDEYKSLAAHLKTLYELRKKDDVSKETWATIGANLAGVLLIINHERAHVIATKALGLVKKIV